MGKITSLGRAARKRRIHGVVAAEEDVVKVVDAADVVAVLDIVGLVVVAPRAVVIVEDVGGIGDCLAKRDGCSTAVLALVATMGAFSLGVDSIEEEEEEAVGVDSIEEEEEEAVDGPSNVAARLLVAASKVEVIVGGGFFLGGCCFMGTTGAANDKEGALFVADLVVEESSNGSPTCDCFFGCEPPPRVASALVVSGRQVADAMMDDLCCCFSCCCCCWNNGRQRGILDRSDGRIVVVGLSVSLEVEECFFFRRTTTDGRRRVAILFGTSWSFWIAGTAGGCCRCFSVFVC
jgi:hypothetical protein